MKCRKPIKRIRTQLWIIFISLATLVCLLTAITVYGQAKRQFELLYAQVNRSNLKASSEILSLKLRPLIDTVRDSVFSEHFIADLNAPNLAVNSRLEDNSVTRSLKREMSRLMQKNTDIAALLLFDNQNRYLCLATSTEKEYNAYYTEQTERAEPWYQAALDASGKEVFYGYNVLTNSDKQITFVKSIRDPMNLNQLAILVVVLGNDVVRKIAFDWDVERTAHSTMVVDIKANKLVLSSTDDTQGEQMLAAYRQSLTSGQAARQSDYAFDTYQNDATGWLFINGIHKSALSSLSSYLLENVIGLVVVILLMGLTLSVAVTGYISKPLDKLKKAIDGFGRENGPITAVFDDSEIGVIGTVLKDTVNKNIELNRRTAQLQLREKEAEYKALQAQINPHFLYNALDSLYFMAVLNNVNDIADMTAALADIFRITLNKGQDFLPLGEELDYIRKYMFIQELRFSHRFTLAIDCPEELLPYRIPKFLIQPFVENAVCHGFEPHAGTGTIQVLCQAQEGCCLIRVLDDGLGIADMRQISRGYGINNVKERIQLLYGSPYGISIKSRPGQGTAVTIRLPATDETIGKIQSEHRLI